jgi:hypothetical protein
MSVSFVETWSHEVDLPLPVDETPGDDISVAERYRVAAFPLDCALTNDVIINDRDGRRYLLSDESALPIPLLPEDVNALGLFFEPSQDASWHTVSELRRIVFGETLASSGGA